MIQPIFIAGPCVIESQELLYIVAENLEEISEKEMAEAVHYREMAERFWR